MEDYARNTRNVLHGLGITILILACILIVIALVFFALKNHPTLNKNPVKVMYIIAIIIFVLSVILGIIYLCKSNSLDETTGTYNN